MIANKHKYLFAVLVLLKCMEWKHTTLCRIGVCVIVCVYMWDSTPCHVWLCLSHKLSCGVWYVVGWGWGSYRVTSRHHLLYVALYDSYMYHDRPVVWRSYGMQRDMLSFLLLFNITLCGVYDTVCLFVVQLNSLISVSATFIHLRCLWLPFNSRKLLFSSYNNANIAQTSWHI